MISWYLSRLSLVVLLGRLFGTFGGHIESRSVVQFGCHIRVIRYLVQNCFGSRICVHSESRLECFGSYISLVRHGSGSFDLSSLRCICRYTGRPSYARWTYRLRSQGALSGSPPGVLVDSSVGVLAITWLRALIVVLWVHPSICLQVHLPLPAFSIGECISRCSVLHCRYGNYFR